MDEQEVQENKLKRFIKEVIRVIRITKKPTLPEYKSLLKVTGLGISIIGLLGFVIFLINQLLF
jgi:protein transport protein SEC61 subunit gamma-like protein